MYPPHTSHLIGGAMAQGRGEGVPVAFRDRPFSRRERQLLEALQPLLNGEEDLPDVAEVEPGGFLWLVREAWREGAHRDGRSGHLTDEQVADFIKDKADPEFDRNRYQSVFGMGKRLKGKKKRYFQPVKKEVARAFLQVALNHWDAPFDKDSDDPFAGYAPFAGLDVASIERAIGHAVNAMYVDEERKVYCRQPLGLGARSLYRELGIGGFSFVSIGRDEAIRMDDFDRQIAELARLLNLLLCQGRGEAAKAVHVWAIREPKIVDFRMEEIPGISRRLRTFARLQAYLKVLAWLDGAGMGKVRPIALDRCIVAVRSLDAGPGHVFSDETPPIWRAQGVPADASASVPGFARNPEGQNRFFSFSARRASDVAPFIELTDPKTPLVEELLEVLEGARATGDRARKVGDWTFYPVKRFLALGEEWMGGSK